MIKCEGQPTQMPTPPVVPGCPSEFVAAGIVGKDYVWNNWTTDNTNVIQFSICSSISSTCGESGQMCSISSKNCCGACQSWLESDGPAGASMGKYFGYNRLPNNTVRLYYVGGDIVNLPPNNIGRTMYMDIRQVPSGPPVDPVRFIPAEGHERGEPYIFRLYINTNIKMCTGLKGCDSCTGSQCVFCLTNSKCQSSISGCNSYILNSTVCPNICSRSKNCATCTTNQTDRQCAWCLGQNICTNRKEACTHGVVRDTKFCPAA